MDITTIKLQKETKMRLEKLREHKRETYDDIIKKIFSILSVCRVEPEKARGILTTIDQRNKSVK